MRTLKRIVIIIISTITISFFLSCKTKHLQTEKINTKDSIVITEINRPIFDTLKIKIDNIQNRECDSLINSILSKINFSKQSGNQGYTLTYNELQRLLELSIKIPETKDLKSSSNQIKTETIEIPVQQPIPIIYQISLGFFIAFFSGILIFLISKIKL